jgi:hypothetical protein
VAATKTETVSIVIPPINVKRVELRLVGDSPLIQHKWSEKAKKEMLDKQMKKGKQAKQAKDPWMDFCESMYWLTPMPAQPTEDDIKAAEFGFPCVAFKAAAVGACRFSDGIKMTEARGAFHVVGELARIEGTPVMREDMVRVGMGTADLRYRGEFNEWATTITLSYNTNVLTLEQIANLFNLAGFGVGVGEWRPEKDGSYGRFHVA